MTKGPGPQVLQASHSSLPPGPYQRPSQDMVAYFFKDSKENLSTEHKNDGITDMDIMI